MRKIYECCFKMIHMGKSVEVSLRMDEELLDKAKVEAVVRGVTLAQVINEALKKALGLDQDQ